MNNIINLESSNELSKEIVRSLYNKNNILSIFFNKNDSKEQINIFLNNHIKIKNIYLDDNYKIAINMYEYNLDLYIFLIDCIDISYNIISSKTNKYINLFENLNKWNICICDNIMFNYPFTLKNIIYLPLNYIKECFNFNHSKKLINTLIHEKIHLGQRENENLWYNFINNNEKKWIKINLHSNIYNIIEQITNNSNQKNLDDLNLKNHYFISNPDTFHKNFKYIYLDNNKYYYGHYIYDKKTKQIEKKYFQIDLNKQKFINTNKILIEDDPYEIYAYKISNELVNNF